MAIIRESVNLTAGLGETIYTVPTGKQSSLSVSISNAADTSVAVQSADLSNSPVPNVNTALSNDTFAFFNDTIGYEIVGTSTTFALYKRDANNKYARTGTAYGSANAPHSYQIPLATGFNYNNQVAYFFNNDMTWKPSGAFSTDGQTSTYNFLNFYSGGASSISTRGLSFQNNNSNYVQYYNLHTTPVVYEANLGRYYDLYQQGWRPNNYSGSNLYNGTSSHYIYKQMHKSDESPLVMMWDFGLISTSSNNIFGKTLQFTGIPAGCGIWWIQESGGYTVIATTSGQTTGTPQLWVVNQSAWATGTDYSTGASATCTEITTAEWSAAYSNPERLKPFVDSNTGIFYFRTSSTPYPISYNANTNTWASTAYPPALTYPAEIAGLEATLGDAYSFYKYSSTLNDYYIVAGSNVYTLIPNYNSLDANSSLLNGLQNDSEKGGLTLKAGDKVIAYDTLSGGTVVQVYGYEEDA